MIPIPPLPRIMVAPNGARRMPADHPALPVTLVQLLDCAAACHAAGAGGLHAHVRDADGLHVLDAGIYRELLAECDRLLPDMTIQITTEAVGRYTAVQQRALVQDLMPRAVSIALGEILSDGDKGATARLFGTCNEAGIAVQHILYSADEVIRLAQLVEEGVVPARGLQLLHVLGRYRVGQTSAPADLDAPLARQQASGLDADWAVCAFGPAETACLAEAARRGGKTRVGFENNVIMADGSLAPNNATRVAEVVAALARFRHMPP